VQWWLCDKFLVATAQRGQWPQPNGAAAQVQKNLVKKSNVAS